MCLNQSDVLLPAWGKTNRDMKEGGSVLFCNQSKMNEKHDINISYLFCVSAEETEQKQIKVFFFLFFFSNTRTSVRPQIFAGTM